MAAKFVAAIDHGTTQHTLHPLRRATARPIATAQREQTMHYPRPGWVELDMDEVWNRTQECIHEALGSAGAAPADVAAIGITNEREIGRPLGSADGTPGRALRSPGRTPGRPPPPTRSPPTEASTVPGSHRPADLDVLVRPEACVAARPGPGPAREAADRGDLLFGTPDTWLLWNLTGGPDGGVHATDPTNAGRTLLMNLHTLEWDDGPARRSCGSRVRCFPRSALRARCTARRSATCPACPSRASSATSRRRCSATRASTTAT